VGVKIQDQEEQRGHKRAQETVWPYFSHPTRTARDSRVESMGKDDIFMTLLISTVSMFCDAKECSVFLYFLLNVQ
jgi:hypothetical protein